MTSALRDLLERHVAGGAVPGVVASLGASLGTGLGAGPGALPGNGVGTALGAAEPEIVAVGRVSVGGAPMRADAIMRVRSMTKAVTAVAALRLVAAGSLGLDEPVERWLPELADRRVLKSPTADLGDTSPAVRAITPRHLLSCTSGYGMIVAESPLQRAMADAEIAVDVEPRTLASDDWLARLAALPLAFEPGEEWRYHHSFGILGILIARVVGRPLHDHLTDDLLVPLGLHDTGLWVPPGSVDRLVAAYRQTDAGLVEIEPAAGGSFAGRPPFDVSHAELVSTAGDYTRFARMLADGGRFEGRRILSEEHLRLMTTDQVPAAAKTPDSFFPGFWDSTGWGFGLGVDTAGEHVGRCGWSGGLGTNFFVDPDGTVGVLLTQVEIGAWTQPLLAEFHALPAAA
ncbi:serine hydrolase domain-containing protein [Asanoa iriomotensis]|uniref:Serine hydrolase n=1 Tax=Asanoa iriomotensis TaxID=234613 RepID=A0ABQ4C9T0_9ACTN|nr:serine hydrolase domain-containing protein [Asanoa iriomotensis]GIF59542.1 serine hydrolase [Asanoa iriomotensis]